jgi:hypothetical protein
MSRRKIAKELARLHQHRDKDGYRFGRHHLVGVGHSKESTQVAHDYTVKKDQEEPKFGRQETT